MRVVRHILLAILTLLIVFMIVLIAWWRPRPVCFTFEVPDRLISKWLPRANHIMLVELFAAVAINDHFGQELYGKRVVGLIDSEPALDSIIKGLSKFDDIVELLTVLWKGIAENQITFYADKVSTPRTATSATSSRGTTSPWPTPAAGTRSTSRTPKSSTRDQLWSAIEPRRLLTSPPRTAWEPRGGDDLYHDMMV